jgi:chromosome segregation ATPase
LADTIKILNDDDALEMFKKTLPGAGSSFMEMTVSSTQMRARALALIRAARDAKPGRSSLDFIALAISGKKIGFDKVITMIDELVATLKQEQSDDNAKKDYCEAEFDKADDKKKGLERDVSDSKDAIEVAKDSIANLADEIAKLTAGIQALDKAVADATEQRKEENTEYKDLIASDTTAKEILGFAKNRLNKFYNPKLYKPPAKKELSAEDRIQESFSFMQVSAHDEDKVAPPPPPETMGAYKKSKGESGGVIAMIDLLVKELDKEMQTAKMEEKDAQADYETMMEDSKEKRAEDSKSVEDKEGAKANAEKSLEEHKATLASTTKELGATLQYIASLHAECDWLLQYFDVRKEARTDEIDALGKAKAVLNGADYSLLQTRRGFLKRA